MLVVIWCLHEGLVCAAAAHTDTSNTWLPCHLPCRSPHTHAAFYATPQVRGKLATHSAMQAALAQQRKEMEAARFSELLAAGQNPYEVYRRQENEAEV